MVRAGKGRDGADDDHRRAGDPVEPDQIGEVADPATVPEQRVHVRMLLTRDGRDQRHEVVVETRPGRITAFGLTPMGTLAYRVDHDEHGVEVENRVGRFLGLDAGRAYDAIARGLLLADSAAARDLSVDGGACGYQARIRVLSDPPPGSPAAPPPG